jgi:hypothetical protein
MNEKVYTQVELEIELIKNNQNHIFKILERLEQKVDSHFHWTIGSLSVLYVSLLGTLVTALAKSLNWF